MEEAVSKLKAVVTTRPVNHKILNATHHAKAFSPVLGAKLPPQSDNDQSLILASNADISEFEMTHLALNRTSRLTAQEDLKVELSAKKSSVLQGEVS